MPSWLLPSHVGCVAVYAVVGYAYMVLNGTTTLAVAGYLTGLVFLLSIIAWHWWKGFYN